MKPVLELARHVVELIAECRELVAPLDRDGRREVPATEPTGRLQEAIELTRRFLKVHGDEWDIECEVRQLDGPEFGSEA